MNFSRKKSIFLRKMSIFGEKCRFLEKNVDLLFVEKCRLKSIAQERSGSLRNAQERSGTVMNAQERS
jgi:hypothetical protein